MLTRATRTAIRNNVVVAQKRSLFNTSAIKTQNQKVSEIFQRIFPYRLIQQIIRILAQQTKNSLQCFQAD